MDEKTEDESVYPSAMDLMNEIEMDLLNKFDKLSEFAFVNRTFFSDFIEKGMGKFAYFVSRFRFLVLLLSLGFAIVCAFGFKKFSINVGQELFVPLGSESLDNILDMSYTFLLGPIPSLSEILVITEGDTNILEKEQVDKIWEIDQAVREAVAMREVTYEDVCLKSFSLETDGVNATGGVHATDGVHAHCEAMGFLNFWNSDLDLYNRTVTSDYDVIAAVNSPEYPNGAPVWPKHVLGGIERDAESGLIHRANSVILQYPTYFQTSAYEGVELLELRRRATPKWEMMFWNLDILQKGEYEGLKIYHNNRRNEQQHRVDSQADLMSKIVISGILITVFSALGAMTLKTPQVKRKRHLHWFAGITGIFSTLLSVISGFGICFYFEVPCSLLNLILPPMLFGIGADDMFVLISHYEGTDPKSSTHERAQKTLEECAPALMFTFLSSFLAFALGMSGNTPAMRNFSVYASVCLTLDFLYQVSLFLSLLLIYEEIERYGFHYCFARQAKRTELEMKAEMKEELEKLKTQDSVMFNRSTQRSVMVRLVQAKEKENSQAFRLQGRLKKQAEKRNLMVDEVVSKEDVIEESRQHVKASEQATLHGEEIEVDLETPNAFDGHPFEKKEKSPHASVGIAMKKLFSGGKVRGERSKSLSQTEFKPTEITIDQQQSEIDAVEKGLCSDWIFSSIIRLLMSKTGCFLTVLFVLAYWIFMGIAAVRLQDGFDKTIFFPDNSQGSRFVRNSQEVGLYPLTSSFEVNIIFENIKFTDPGVQTKIVGFEQALTANSRYFLDPFDSVFAFLSQKKEEFVDLCGREVDDITTLTAWSLQDRRFDRFIDDFAMFDLEQYDDLNTSVSDFETELITLEKWDTGEDICGNHFSNITEQLSNITVTGQLNTSTVRTQVSFTDMSTTNTQRRALEKMSSMIEEHFGKDANVYAVDNHYAFMFLDILDGLQYTVISSMIFGLICLLILSLLFTGSIRQSAVICLLLVVVDYCVYALPYVMGYKANVASYMVIAVAFGLVVNYFVHFISTYEHVCHQFHESSASTASIELTIVKVSPAMLLASFTSVISIVPLLFSKAPLGRVLSQVYGLITLTGLLHGLVVLPVFLSIGSRIKLWLKATIFKSHSGKS